MTKLRAFLRPLYVQVLIAIGLAIIVGLIWPDTGKSLKPLGDSFIALLKILIGPIIFCTIVLGLNQIRDLAKLGRVAIKALIYFEVVSTLALAIGLVVGNVFRPGDGITAPEQEHEKIADYAEQAKQAGGIVEFFQGLIPGTFFSAFAEGEILQILILAILFGVATLLLGEKVPAILPFIEQAQKIFFKMLGFIMRLAPFGAFGAMAYTVGAHGGSTLLDLLTFVLLLYATAAAFIFVVLGAIAAFSGLSIFKILRLIREEILLVLGTSSSEVALPRLLDKLERAGVEKSVVGLVVPSGYSFNTDGTAIYMSMAIVFLAQITDTPLSIGEQLAVLAVLMFTSKGGAAVSGAGFVKLTATLQSVPAVPLSGLGVLIGVDRFMSEARSITNMIGNTVATFAIAKWDGSFDSAKFHAYYRNPVIGEDAEQAGSTPDTNKPDPAAPRA